MEGDSKVPIPKQLLEKLTGCEVVSYTVEGGSKPGDNYMSVLYSVTAELLPPNKASEEKETRHYLFKCHPEHPSRQEYLKETNMFYNELKFYTVWAKELVKFQEEILGEGSDRITYPQFPTCIGGETIDFSSTPEGKGRELMSLDNFVMMTDMKKSFGYKMLDRTCMFDVDHMLLVFKELAVIHALSWGYKQKKGVDLLEKFPFLKSPFKDDDIQFWTKICRGNVDIAVRTLDAALGEGNHLSESTKKFKEDMIRYVEFFLFQRIGMEEELWKMQRDPPKELVDASKDEEPWRVIIHGDCWSANTLFKYDPSTGKPEQALLLDFQLSRLACPSVDFVHLLYTSTTFQFRETNLDILFQAYHDKFLQVCNTLKTEPLPGFSVSSIKRKFYCARPIGYVMAISMLPMKLNVEDQPVNLEELDKTAKMDDMFSEAFRAGSGGSMYQTCMLETAQELYRDGVI